MISLRKNQKNVCNFLLIMLIVFFLTQTTSVAAGNVVTSAAGKDHSLILKSDGTVWVWGNNDYGKLGNGTTVVQKNVPVQVTGLTNVTRIAAGEDFSLALKNDGTVWTWGGNYVGQLGNDSTAHHVTAPVKVVDLTNVTEIAAGKSHGLALKKDGSVWIWGSNQDFQYGSPQSRKPIKVELLTDVRAIAAGGSHSLAVKKDGTVWGWGNNTTGQLTLSPDSRFSFTPTQIKNLTNIISVAAGEYHNLALDVNGKVYTWGSNYYGEIGNGSGSMQFAPVQVPDLNDIVEIASGSSSFHSLALKKDGTVYAWGLNENGQLGNGTTINNNKPVQVKFNP